MSKRTFFQLTSSLLDVKKRSFFKPINRTQIYNLYGNAPGAPQKKLVAIENSLRVHTCGSPAAAAEMVY